MAPRVLDVGNCGYDHAKISQLLEREFGAEVVTADTASETLERLAVKLSIWCSSIANWTMITAMASRSSNSLRIILSFQLYP